jgi:RNA polymerase sigma factor (sigma-70 family)
MSGHAARMPAGRMRPVRLRWCSDEQLARLAAGGERRAFALLYERHHQTLYRYCRSIVRNEQDAQDALQATMSAALASVGRLQEGVPIRAWLFRIAHNESISLLRRRRTNTALEDAPEPASESSEAASAQRARLAVLVADLQDLPERQRAALVMRELSGLAHEEIAIALSISTGAAKQAIFEARGALAEFVEGRAMACEEVRRAISDGDGRVLRGRRMRAHLRDCALCADFRAAIPNRRAALAALAPALPAAGAAGGLARLLGGGHPTHGAHGVRAALSAKAASAPLGAKLLVGGLVIAAAAGGATAPGLLNQHSSKTSSSAPLPAAVRHPGPPTARRVPAHAHTAATPSLTAALATRGGRDDSGGAAKLAGHTPNDATPPTSAITNAGRPPTAAIGSASGSSLHGSTPRRTAATSRQSSNRPGARRHPTGSTAPTRSPARPSTSHAQAQAPSATRSPNARQPSGATAGEGQATVHVQLPASPAPDPTGQSTPATPPPAPPTQGAPAPSPHGSVAGH